MLTVTVHQLSHKPTVWQVPGDLDAVTAEFSRDLANNRPILGRTAAGSILIPAALVTRITVEETP